MACERRWPASPDLVDGADLDVLLAVEPGALDPEDRRRALATVTALRARIDAAAAALVGTVDARGDWAHDGAKGTTPWLVARGHGSHRACRAELDVARAVRQMPLVEAAARAGRLSREKVRALAWARQPGLEDAFAACEDQLVAEVEAPTVAGAWRYLRRWVEAVRAALGLNDPDGPEPTDGTGRSKMTLATGLEGRWFGSLDLEAEHGEVVANAVDHQMEAMWEAKVFDKDDGLTTPERRAQALVEVLTRGTRGGDGDGTARPLVMALIDVATLTGSPEGPDAPLSADEVVMQLSELSRSGPVPSEAIRRLACEGDVVPVVVEADGTPLDMGRSIRLANRRQRRALRVRDGHCTFAGCTAPAEHCIAHHLLPWEAGGPTDLANLALLCRFHHGMVHEGGFRLARGPDGTLATHRPDGTEVTDARPSEPRPLHRHRARASPDHEALVLHRATRTRIERLVAQARAHHRNDRTRSRTGPSP